ncbi:MAG: rod shape-determining protein MreC [PVC group bacterium]
MRRIVVAVAVALFLIILLSLSPSFSAFLKIRLAEVAAPIHSAAAAVFLPAGVLAENIGRIIQAARINPRLEEQNAFLTVEVARLREVENENEALRSLLDFKRKQRYSGVVARVIGRDIYHWNQSILIDKGGADGVVREAAVVSARGVVGKVVEVAPHLSRVLLIIDRTSGVGGMIQSSRQTGIVEGTTDGGCVMKYLPRRPPILPGEAVITSGLGQIYPPGLLIGTITGVYEQEFGLYQYADLEPATRFDRLEQVMVLQ